ncbi:MAG: hypothetical protein FWG03_09540 [Clostridiales bacterium]|nr:hypothetical protein [Clostridiales bacterium]
MIEKKEVVHVKVPYPDISPGLAKRVHTYICAKKAYAAKRLVKCQSMKLSSIIRGAGVTNYIVESSNAARNPFPRTTLIDCDKLYIADIKIPRTLLATPRPDVSQKLYEEIIEKITIGLPSRHKLPRDETAVLNRLEKLE